MFKKIKKFFYGIFGDEIILAGKKIYLKEKHPFDVHTENFNSRPATSGEITEENAIGFINNIWEIEVRGYDGEQLVKLPFCFLIHDYLKTYGFIPSPVNGDNSEANKAKEKQLLKMMKNSPEVILRLAPGSEAKLKLFIKSLKTEK